MPVCKLALSAVMVFRPSSSSLAVLVASTVCCSVNSLLSLIFDMYQAPAVNYARFALNTSVLWLNALAVTVAVQGNVSLTVAATYCAYCTPAVGFACFLARYAAVKLYFRESDRERATPIAEDLRRFFCYFCQGREGAVSPAERATQSVELQSIEINLKSRNAWN
jgi:hypothetical protein